MKKILKKSLVLAAVVFLSVLFTAPAMLHADTVLQFIEIDQYYLLEIPAIGQTTEFTATANYYDEATEEWSTEDVTTTATWVTDDPSVAIIGEHTGVVTGVGEGSTTVTVTYTHAGVTETDHGWVNVLVPYLWISPGLPGETTGFGIWASNCSGLSWSLVVEKDSTEIYSASGTISSDEWNYNASYTLSEGGYTATLSVDGIVQDTKNFSVWEHTASMNVSTGYAGETTTFTLNATNSSGKTGQFTLSRESSDGYWDNIYIEDDISIDNDDWSYTITQTLTTGNYWAGFWIEDCWGGSYDFSVVNRGVPQPPVEKAVEKATVKKAAVVKHGPAINEKPLSSYEKTASGFTTLFYNRILRRNPEKEGLKAWTAGLESGAITGSDLVYLFIFGEECQKVISKYTNEEFLTFLYKAIFNRKPDEDGYNAWLSRTADGMTKEEVVKQFGLSDEFISLCNLFGIKPYPGYTGTSE